MDKPYQIDKFVSNAYEYFEKVWPISQLKNTIENNDWHLNQSVLDHTYKVFESIPLLLFSDHPFLWKLKPARDKLVHYIEEIIDKKYSRFDLMRFSALFHDIGKVNTIKIDKNGITSCPNHAYESVRLFDDIIGFFDISSSHVRYIKEIMLKHHDADKVVDAINRAEFELVVHNFYKENSFQYLELLIFYLADFEGCKIGEAIREKKPFIYEVISQLIIDKIK